MKKDRQTDRQSKMNTNEHLHAALEQLRAHRDKIDTAIHGLELVLGVAAPSSIATAAAASTNGNGRVRKPRPFAHSDDDLDASILDVLKKHGPMSPADLAQRVKVSPPMMRRRLKQLRSRVVLTGATMNRRVALPGKTPAKEAQS